VDVDLEKVFRAINRKMLIDFEEISAAIKHRGAKGRVREQEIVTEYLSKYIPGNIGLANGEIISADGQVSSETDIILFERNTTPYLLTKESYQVLPIECVYGVIEVKSRLDQTQLEDAYSKINRVKRMPKLALELHQGPIVRTTTIYDREWSFFPTLGFVIAFDSVDLRTLREHYLELIEDCPSEHRIDSIWVLNKGMLVNYNQTRGLIELAPGKDCVVRAMLSDNPLMLLTIQMQSLLLSAWMPNFMIKEYLQHANFGKLYD
jgi:hypothetical protein